jgi:hypothetical protein
MNTLLRPALIAAALLAPAAALAHPGDHAGMSLAQAARHVTASPDHLAMLVVLVAVAAGGVIRLSRRPAR